MSTPTAEQVREFVIAGHGNLAKVREMLDAQPELLNLAHPWSETDHETAIQAASHVGNAALAEFLLSRGAPLAIYTAAMLGRRAEVDALLAADPDCPRRPGAHGVPVLPHAAFSGDLALLKALYAAGATEGASMALSFAVAGGHADLAAWLLAHTDADPHWKNSQGKTALERARERGDAAMVALLSQPAAGAPSARSTPQP